MTAVTITNTKENVLQFDVSVEGTSTTDTKVRFVVETHDVDMSFDAKCESNDTWNVKIPALSSLEKTAYNYRIEVIVDGYYFEPTKGVLNVVGSHELYASTPKNVTLAPKEESKKEEPKSEHKKKDESVTSNKEEPKVEVKKQEPKLEEKKEKKVDESKPNPLLMSLSGITETPIIPVTEVKEVVTSQKDQDVKKILQESKKKVVTTVPFKKKAVKLH